MKAHVLDERIMNAAAVASERARDTGGYALLTPAESSEMIVIGRETAGATQRANDERHRERLALLGQLRNGRGDSDSREELAHAMLVTLKREHEERERVRNRAREGAWYATFPPFYANHATHLDAVNVIAALAQAFGIAAPTVQWCRELTADEAEAQLRARAGNLLHEKSQISAITDGVTVTLNETLLYDRAELINCCAHEVFHAADMTASEDDARMFGTTFMYEYKRRFATAESGPGPADLAEIADDFVSAERQRS